MSVLLEALKKAAEEKKKKSSHSDLSTNVGNESSEDLPSQKKEGLGFSLPSKNATEQNQSDSPLNSETEDKVSQNSSDTEFLSLKLTPKETEVERSDLLGEEVEAPPVSSTVSLKTTEIELDSDFDSKRTPEEIEEFISPSFLKDDRAPTPEPRKPKPALQISENDEDLLAEATASFDEEVLSTPVAQVSLNKIEVDENTEVLNRPKTPPLDTTIATEAFKSDEELPERNADKHKDIEDSYKWSMNDLPGYDDAESPQNLTQSEIDSNPQDKTSLDETALAENPVLTKGENRRLNLVAKKGVSFNPKFLIYVGVLGLFIGLFFYAILYFQDQNQALEDSFKKYQITRIEPSAALLAKNQQSLPAGKESPKALGEDNITSRDNPEPIEQKEVLEKNSIDSVSEKTSTPQGVSASDAIKAIETQEKAVTDLTNGGEAVLVEDEKKLVSSDNNSQTTEKPIVNKPEKVVNSAPLKATTIQKSQGLSPEKLKLKAAYQAYQQKKWALAELFFSEVIALNPENINAQLGLAGSLLNQQKFKDSLDVYYQVLESSPNNLYAVEGIASIMQQFSSQNSQWQETLMEVLKDYPDSAFLKSAMGNIFAQQNNWQEAQSYYFEALALEPSNAMYNYNLAISLDYLKQYGLAIEYYTKALLYKTNQTNFDEVVIKTRLAALKLFMEKGDY